MSLNVINKIKTSFRNRILSRKLYDAEMVSTLDDEQIVHLRSKYLRHLSFYSVLLIFSFFALLGVFLLGSPKQDFTKDLKTYQTEQDFLAKKLDSIYGKGNWQYGIYQTKIDAYRVEVKLSDGSKVNHYYQVRQGNIYRLNLEE